MPAASHYEGLFLAGLACLAFLFRRQWRLSIALGFSALLSMTIFGVLAMTQRAFFFPNSLMLKTGEERISIVSALFKPLGREDWLC